MIKIGCCIPGASLMPEGVKDVPLSPVNEIKEKCSLVLAAGFDYTECGAGMINALSEEELKELLEANEKNPLGLLAVNSMFPGDFRIGSDTGDFETYKAYTVKMFDRLKLFGIKYSVFGSGSARSTHDEDDKEKSALKRLEFISFMAEEAGKRDITLCLEPLRKGETNFANTVNEGADIVESISHPSFKLLADAFHMAENGECPLDASKHIDILRHCHMAESPKRSKPGCDDSKDLEFNKKFAKSLIEAGYTGGVSAECGFGDFRKDIYDISKYMKQIFERN